MADWEDEDLEANDNNEEDKKMVFNEFDDESEVIPVEKEEKVETKAVQKEKETDEYEKKYQARKKKDIAIMKEIEESVKNIEDPELRLKKKLELMRLKQVEKFMGEDNEDDKDQKLEEINLDFDLKTEKDYINLAQKSAAKINQTNKSSTNVYEFMKASMELLLPTLSEDLIENVKNAVIFLKNKKDKKGDKKQKGKEKEKEKEIAPKSDKFEERKALYKQYGDGDIGANKPDGEDDYNDDGDFM